MEFEKSRGDVVLVRTAWTLAALSLVLYATIPLSLSGGVTDRPDIVSGRQRDVFEGLVIVAFSVSGGWLVHARTRNPVGWLILASGFLQALQTSLEAYGARALTDPDGSLPLGLPALWIASWSWMPSLALVMALLPGLYPTGRPTSTFWRWQVRAAMVAIVLVVLVGVTMEGGIDDTVRGEEVPWNVPTWLQASIAIPAAVFIIASVATALVGTLVRAVRAGPGERQQLLWFFAFLLAMVAGFFSPSEVFFDIAYALCPIAVLVGVLRYQMLGIEIVLRRTLLYAPLILLVALLVGGSTTALARLLPDGPLPLLIGSAVAAVLLFPVANRLRGVVDRFVLGDRVDPLLAVDRVGAELEIAAADPVPSMLEAVAAATGATFACVTDEAGTELARVGDPVPGVLEAPLRHAGRDIGLLTVGPRRKESRVSEVDARLVSALAPHLAVVVRSRVLTRDLEVERERVTAATLAERDRLRRDLHDGLGPSLSGISLGLQAALSVLGDDTDAARKILVRTREEATSAVAEVRLIINGLRPSVLDRFGLVGAVRDTATSLGMGAPGGTDFHLDAEEVSRLTPSVEETAYRILAESLNNVSRHAGATRCTVSVRQVEDTLRLQICDDGIGLDPDHVPGEGLASMRRRATDLGGQVAVRRLAPTGTEVLAMLPLESA